MKNDTNHIKLSLLLVLTTNLLFPYPTIEYDLPAPVCPYAKSEQLKPASVYEVQYVINKFEDMATAQKYCCVVWP